MNDREQIESLSLAVGAGWRVERNWLKIKARYGDYDLARQVPQAITFVDIGVLCGYIAQLEKIIYDHGWEIQHAEEPSHDRR